MNEVQDDAGYLVGRWVAGDTSGPAPTHMAGKGSARCAPAATISSPHPKSVGRAAVIRQSDRPSGHSARRLARLGVVISTS